MFTASFDEASLKQIAAFAGFPVLLSEEVQEAEGKLADLLIQKIQDNGLARFAQNSPGGLAESFVRVQEGQMEVMVGSDKPYAHRLNDGFDGADSLGRVYHNQPTWFFSDAITEVETSGEGMEILQAGVYKALDRMGG